jgi:hypothetical protein
VADYPAAADLCVAVIGREAISKSADFHRFYERLLKALGGDVRLAEQLPEQIVAATRRNAPTVPTGNPVKELEIEPAIAFDAGYVSGYSGHDQPAAALDGATARPAIEDCLAQKSSDPASCAAMGYALGTRQALEDSAIIHESSGDMARESLGVLFDPQILKCYSAGSSSRAQKKFVQFLYKRKAEIDRLLSRNTEDDNLEAFHKIRDLYAFTQLAMKPNCMPPPAKGRIEAIP